MQKYQFFIYQAFSVANRTKSMETVTIFELNEMYGSVSHKLGEVFLNEKSITWQGWIERSAQLERETQVGYLLGPTSKALHIFLKILPANPFLQ